MCLFNLNLFRFYVPVLPFAHVKQKFNANLNASLKEFFKSMGDVSLPAVVVVVAKERIGQIMYIEANIWDKIFRCVFHEQVLYNAKD